VAVKLAGLDERNHAFMALLLEDDGLMPGNAVRWWWRPMARGGAMPGVKYFKIFALGC
jgi:hypothetical protein